MRLAGKTALITGGSRGLGLEMAQAFAAEGADLIIASRKLDGCVSAAAAIADAHGVRALPVECNVSEWDACDRLVDRAYAEFDAVDILVNNAGMSPLYPSLDQVSEALFDKVIGVNLRGPFRLTALIGQRMQADAGGSIINISSVESIRPDAFALPYAAAKAGLNVLTEGFAQAFGPTVRVNTIQCGAFATDISQAWPAEFSAHIEANTALRRVGSPGEIAGAALYLASGDSSYTTGSTVRLDGGVR